MSVSLDVRTSLIERVQREGHRILQYWQDNVICPDGSFIGTIAHDGTKHMEADLSVILASRILWTCSRAVSSQFLNTSELVASAHLSFTFFTTHFWDPVHFGFYWLIDRDNRPVNPRKHIYAQAFSIYALSEYYAAFGVESALELARQTYEAIETYARDHSTGGYLEAFTRNWTKDTDLRLSGADMNEEKSMNTHLHLLEAYTRLYGVWPNEKLRNTIIDLLAVIKTHILDNSNHHYQLFFDSNWAVKSDIVSYGHDIEGSWLMLEAAECVADSGLITEFKRIAIDMVDSVLAEGLDADYGVFNEGRGTAVVDGDKHWWPQAEAVVGCVNAYQITGDKRYLEFANNIWTFIDSYMLDRNNGEWLWKVSRDGSPDRTRPVVEPWKCPYHNTRACIEVWSRLNDDVRRP